MFMTILFNVTKNFIRTWEPQVFMLLDDWVCHVDKGKRHLAVLHIFQAFIYLYVFRVLFNTISPHYINNHNLISSVNLITSYKSHLVFYDTTLFFIKDDLLYNIQKF